MIDPEIGITEDYFWKRPFDILVSGSLLLVVVIPLIVLLVIASISTREPGLFLQTRVGRGGKPFSVFKIRTMRTDPLNKSTTTTKQDPRVTRFGAFARKFKLDELPQLLNVFAGQMSLVGPRPTVFSDLEQMNSEQKRRFSVRPGLTGLAQVNGNTALSWAARIQFDLRYVRSMSLSEDLEILLKTARLLATNRIETHPENDNEW